VQGALVVQQPQRRRVRSTARLARSLLQVHSGRTKCWLLVQQLRQQSRTAARGKNGKRRSIHDARRQPSSRQRSSRCAANTPLAA
jgi:hypothetical protein